MDLCDILQLSETICSYTDVSLPPPSCLSTLQRTHRLPKEMTPVEPSAFAAQLIARLEKLKREQDTMSSLEERLQQIQEVRIPKKRSHLQVS